MGFFHGSQILENILITCLAFDWIIHHKSQALFLLLDFENAFDKVDFEYIWATLKALGLRGKFLQLIQGFILGAHMKVHINGEFLQPIAIEHGVRQGCPLAPLLFALSMQPLTTFLYHQWLHGFLSGLNITSNLTLGDRLSTDDMGIFLPADHTSFQAFHKCISIYEQASREKLNLTKSTIIPIGVSPIPN